MGGLINLLSLLSAQNVANYGELATRRLLRTAGPCTYRQCKAPNHVGLAYVDLRSTHVAANSQQVPSTTYTACSILALLFSRAVKRDMICSGRVSQFVYELPKDIATARSENDNFRRHHSHMIPPLSREPPRISAYDNPYILTNYLRYIFAAGSMGLFSFKF